MIRFAAAAVVITLHLQVFSIAGFPVTVGGVLGIALITYLRPPSRIRPAIFLLAVLVVVWAGLAFLAQTGLVQAVDFAGTFLLILCSLYVIAVASGASPRGNPVWISVGRGFRDALLIVVGISVLQVAFGAAGSEAFYNPWGAMQYLYPHSPNLQFNPIPRAQGFYLEPSYNAFVIGTCFFVVALLKLAGPATFVLAFIGLLATRSATASILMLAILLVWALTGKRYRLGALLLLLIAAYFGGAEVLERLGSISQTSTSGNFRILAPLPVLFDVLTTHPLGSPLGSVETVMREYDLKNGATAGVSLDNGIYLLIFYFGWLGVAFVGVALVGAVRATARLWTVGAGIAAQAPIWLFGSLVFSGGIFLPEYALMVGVTSLAAGWRLSQDRSLEIDGASNNLVNRERHIS